MKFSGVAGYGPRNNPLNVGADLDPGELSCLGGGLFEVSFMLFSVMSRVKLVQFYCN